MKYNNEIEVLLKKYHFTEKNREDFWNIISPIYNHLYIRIMVKKV